MLSQRLNEIYIQSVGQSNLANSVRNEAAIVNESYGLCNDLIACTENFNLQEKPMNNFHSDNINCFELIEKLKQATETISSIKEEFKVFSNVAEDKDKDDQSQGLVEIISIEHFEHETYEIVIENRKKEEFKDLTIGIQFPDRHIPLGTISSLLDHSKSRSYVDIPISIFLQSGKGDIILTSGGVKLAEKEFYVTEIMEILQKNDIFQLKIKNNTGLTIRGEITNFDAGEALTIVLKPHSKELHEVSANAGGFMIMRGNQISNMVVKE